MAESKDDRKVVSNMEMYMALQQTYEALKLCFNNRFVEAHKLMEPQSRTSMYHAIGYATISYLQALMTYEQEQIQVACQHVKEAGALCQKFRKKQTWTDSVYHLAGKYHFDEYKEEEIHAELCYAECLLLRAILTFIQDENLISFIKGALKIRQAYQLYKFCQSLMQKQPPSLRDTRSRPDFEGGVQLGLGSFNLMLSLLPTRILRLLEWVGFSGNRKLGLELLNEGASKPGLRSPLCALNSLAYHILISHFLGNEDYDLVFAEQRLTSCLVEFPEAAGFLFFKGRLQQIRGRFNEAIGEYHVALKVNVDWKQIHHIIYWEMMWCNCFLLDWKTAIVHANFLSQESKWSKTAYLYLLACLKIMDEITEGGSPRTELSKEIDEILKELPTHKQRVAGKSLPFEKFAIHKAQQYIDNGRFLAVPALETIYIWNGFAMLHHRKELLNRFLQLTIDCQDSLPRKQEEDGLPLDMNSFCLCEFLRGVCSQHLGDKATAQGCFENVIKMSAHSKIDNHLAPFSSAEIGFMLKEAGHHREAKKQLESTRKSYPKHFLISRLHFRIHSALQAIEAGVIHVAPQNETDCFDVINDKDVANGSLDTTTSQEPAQAVTTAAVGLVVDESVSSQSESSQDTSALITTSPQQLLNIETSV